MKKTLFLLAVTVLFLQLTGISQKARVGLTAGITTSNMYGKDNGLEFKGTNRSGATFGMIVDAPIGKGNFSFQPGIHYIQKGKVISETVAEKKFLALNYAETQLNFLYSTKKKISVFAGVGPTVSFDLPSQYVTKTSNATAANINPDPEYSRSEKKVKFGKETSDDFRGIDLGLNALAGFKMKCGFFLALNFTYGYRNLATSNTSNYRIRNSCMGARLGWLFNNK
jgi:hypothetical protein